MHRLALFRWAFRARHNFFWFLQQQYAHFVSFWAPDDNSWETGFYTRFVLGTEIQRSAKTNRTQLGPPGTKTVDLHLDFIFNFIIESLKNLRL